MTDKETLLPIYPGKVTPTDRCSWRFTFVYEGQEYILMSQEYSTASGCKDAMRLFIQLVRKGQIAIDYVVKKVCKEWDNV